MDQITEVANEQYISEIDFNDNCNMQLQLSPHVIEQLRDQGVVCDKELELEYFFYTNSEEKAKNLATEISKLNYTVSFGVSEVSKDRFLVTGWTTKMKMTDDVVNQWIEQMCELGYKFDCNFDGWGTFSE